VLPGRAAQGSPSQPSPYEAQRGFLQARLEAAPAEPQRAGGGTEETAASTIAGATATTEDRTPRFRGNSSTSGCRSGLPLDIKRYTAKVNVLLENWRTRGAA